VSSGVLLVGLGAIGLGYDLDLPQDRYVQTHARAFSGHPDFRLLAGVDPDPRRRRLFTRHYGVPAFAGLDEALELGAPAVVVIATPTPAHSATLAGVLERSRPRVVLCEKPLAPNVLEASAMLDLCRRAGVDLYVNYMRRSLPGVLELRRRIDAGALRDCKGVCWYSKGLLHNGSHFLGLLEYWLGPVRAATRIGGLHAGPAGPEPDCRVVFETGEVHFLATHDPGLAYQEIELVGGDGRLRMDSEGGLEWRGMVPHPTHAGYHVLSPQGERIESGMDRFQAHVAAQVARALAGSAAELCSGDDAMRLQRIIAELERAQLETTE
jgi:predicted dehydrogenase